MTEQRTGALAGLRVVDFGQYLAGPLLSVLLADAGADVVRVDPPTGPRWRHPANAMLQRGKRSIALDLREDGDRDIARRLVERADIVVENFRPGVMDRLGLGAHSALAATPRLLYCSLPGFGADDPRHDLPAWEGVVSAAAGLYLYPGCTPANLIGDRSGEPIYSAIPLASSYAAFIAAHSIVAGLIARERTGAGQRIEVPLFDACFELIGSSVMQSDGPRAAAPPMVGAPPQLARYRCGDGRWLELCLFQDTHLRWFAETFLPPEYIEDGMADAGRMFTDPALQQRAFQRYSELFATRSARDWEIAINEESGASAALCQTSEEWLTIDEHARDSGAVIELDDPEYGHTAQAGFPIRMSGTPPTVGFPRRPLDADRTEILTELDTPISAPAAAPAAVDPVPPLAGIRVLDVAQVLAGPTISRILAEYGADVIKIHSFIDRQLAMHLYTNSGKRSIMLDLKTPDGMAVFNRLSDGIDVFTQNFTRGVADRIGLGEATLRERNPELIYTSISAFGYEGYRGGWRGREQLGQGPTGMQLRLGDEEPVMAPYPYNDYGSGNLAAYATMLALYHRIRGGAGQNVQSSLCHSATFLQIPYMVAHAGRTWDEPSGQTAKGWGPFDRLYQGADRWFYLCAPDGLDSIAELAGNTETELAEHFRTRPAQDWVDLLNAAGVGAHVLTDQPDLMDDEVVRARGLSIEREHRGFGRARMAGPSQRLSVTPPRPTRPVGPPGSDTRAVLDEFGFDSADLIARDVARDGLPQYTTFVGMFR
ncbi:CaiB/BaiF CoA transferase family protein [Nocardia alni]|uniref:CaiB/BaiF CoA transferase family protein n=1 Tax=Nocardia alni TaxID=2815723 RepID=UPI001C22B6D3|nr:CoA transferase [Nocardia alni]